MRRERPQAVHLRKLGKSYNEIQKILGTPKSTLSGWLANVPLSQAAKHRISKRVYLTSLRGLIKRNKLQTKIARQRAKLIRSQSTAEINALEEKDIKIIGASLYWAEGYKKALIYNGKQRISHPVALTNSDPKLVKIFIRFLREICKVDDSRIKIELRLFDHLQVGHVRSFWQKVTGLPAKNFGKIYTGVSKSSQGKRLFNRLLYGTALIRVNDTQLFYRIMGWIDGLSR